jgi:methyl-accepting chemotaxis protein
MKIRNKTVLSGAISVVVSVIVTTLVILNLMRAELTRQAMEYQNAKLRVLHELLNQKGEPKVVDGKLQFGSYVANWNHEVVDKLTALTGGTATVFLHDTRISTNVLKEDGSRAVGTPLVGPPRDYAINQGKPYRGEADILGVPYFTAYDPLLDAQGRTIGVLYVGVKQEDFFRSFRQLVLVAGSVAVLMALIFGLVASYATGRLIRRLSGLAKAADAVSMGEELDTPLTSASQDEVAELAKSIDRLRQSMREALRRLQSGWTA